MTRFLIMHQTVTVHDAIGNDIEAMYLLLNKNNECKVYAENRFNSSLEYISEIDLETWLNDNDVVVIYHHSIFWENGEVYLYRTKGKIIIRYHNITPPEFFEQYNEDYKRVCLEGRKQTSRLAANLPKAYWLSDSYYNLEDICDFVESSKYGVCPPFNKIEIWAKGKPNEGVLQKLLYSEKLNVLFVGRIAPNKGFINLLKIIKLYMLNFGDNIRLRLVGKFDEGLSKYNNEIKDFINLNGLIELVEFVGEIDDAILMSYYLGSDLFLCVSEHEGFCVPLIEAQFFKLPIISIDSSAISETIGCNQVVLKNDITEVVAALKVVGSNRGYRDILRNYGRKNFDERFTYDSVRKCFGEYLNIWCGVNI